MGEFAFWVGVTVVGGLLLAAIIGAVRWLSEAEHRESLRQRLCRHDWEEVKPLVDANIVFVTTYTARCRKCGAIR